MRDGLSQISPLTKAINYMPDHWSGLTRFLDDGRVEPDTNTVERPIRSIAIGKKGLRDFVWLNSRDFIIRASCT